jgi:hypothetical protein
LAGVAGLIYSRVPTLFAGAGGLESFMMVGGILGAGVHQWINALIVNALLRPLSRTVSFNAKLAELSALTRAGVISRGRAVAAKNRIMEERFFRLRGVTQVVHQVPASPPD